MSGGFLYHEPQNKIMKKLKTIIAGFAIVLMSASAFADKHQEAALGNEAPGLVVKNDSTTLSLESLKGKWVILSFWSASDAESRMNQGLVSALHRNAQPAGESTQVEIVSVNFDRSEQLMKEIVRIDNLESEMQFHIANPSEESSIRKAFRMNEGLRTFIINPEGKLEVADPTEEDLKNLYA